MKPETVTVPEQEVRECRVHIIQNLRCSGFVLLNNALVHFITFLISLTIVILGCSLNGQLQSLISQHLQHTARCQKLYAYRASKCARRLEMRHSPLEPAEGTHTSLTGRQMLSDRMCVPRSCCQCSVHSPARHCAPIAPDESLILLSSGNTPTLCHSFLYHAMQKHNGCPWTCFVF